jgi:hypothetical protein
MSFNITKRNPGKPEYVPECYTPGPNANKISAYQKYVDGYERIFGKKGKVQEEEPPQTHTDS